MKKLNVLEEMMKESNHKFTEGPIEEYGIISFQIDEVSVHVCMETDGITWREFPPDGFKFPDCFFEDDVKKEKDRDFLLTNQSADGFLISQKAKEVLERFDLGKHMFLKVNIVFKKGGLFRKSVKKEYYWLHFVFNDLTDDFVDIKNTVFKEKISNRGKILSNEEVRFDSLDSLNEYKKRKHSEWLEDSDNANFHNVIAWVFALNRTKKLPDVLGFSRIDTSEYYFSRALSQAIFDENLKGIAISNTGKIKTDSNVE